MTIQQFLLVMNARFRVILLTLFITVFCALTVSLMLPKQYSASTAVVIDVKSPDPIAGLVLPGMISPAYMATQVDIISSDRVAQRVVHLLHMDEGTEIQEQWREATKGKGNITAWIAGQIQKKLSVKPSRESNVINIGYTDSDPALTAEIANAFAQAYIDVNLELKVEPARQNSAWFDGQTRMARDKLEAAQKAFSSQQQKTGVIAAEDRIDFETTKLNELSSQLTTVQAQTSDSHSKRISPNDAGTLPDVMQSPLVNSLTTEIARLESKLEESNVNLGKNHPQTQRAESELASLRERLNSETRKIVRSIETSYQVGRQKEKELRDAIELQKSRVLGLNRQRDEISVLKRDVESAQRAFEGVSQRSAQTRLESLSVQTNAVVLNAATEPTVHSSPRIKLTLLLSVIFGTFLGASLALILELRNRCVRSPMDLADATGLPVLACVSSTAPPMARRTRFSRNQAPVQTPAAIALREPVGALP